MAAPPGGRVPAPRGLLAAEEFRALVDAGRIDTVLLALPNLQGQLKGKRYAARHFADQVARGGADMCAYVLATDVDMTPLDFELASWETGFADLRTVPDLSTLRALPHARRTALVFADAVHPDGSPVELAPRQMLRGQLDRLAGHGLAVKAGLETEFVLCHGTYEQAQQAGFRGLRPVTADNLDYTLRHPAPLTRFFDRVQGALDGAGTPVEAVKTEGAPGQVEITFPYGDPMRAADGHVVFKQVVRDVAERCRMAPTFMASPETGVGNGFHLHLSLWQEGRSVLTVPDGDPSGTAHRAVAGLLHGLPELAPLYAPTVNSYKRFAPHSFAPDRFTWGMDNRTCAVRVLGHGGEVHLEVRVPGADANPYLALAAAVAAICHGLEDRLELPPACDGDGYRADRGTPVPATLDQALAAFRDSQTAHKAFGSDVVAHYAHAAQVEIDQIRRQVTDVELARGFARA